MFSATDSIPVFLNDEVGGFGWVAMTKAMEYVMDYKMLQYEELQADLKNWETQLLDNPVYRWVDIDEDGNLVETKVSGNTMLADLETGKELNSKIDILSVLNQEITTNNELLNSAVGDLNIEIEELRERLLLEMEEWEIPGYEGKGVDTELVLRNFTELNNEADRVTAVFVQEKDKLIKKYEKENKDIIAEDKKLRSKLEKELGDNAKELNNQIRLYIARIHQFEASGFQPVLKLLYERFGGVLNEDLKNVLEYMQKTYIGSVHHHQAILNEKWGNLGFLGAFLITVTCFSSISSSSKNGSSGC